MALHRGVAPARQQAKALVETVSDIPRCQRRHAGRSQLQRKWNAVEALADLCDRGGVGLRDRESRSHRLRSLGEELHGLTAADRLERAFIRQRQGPQGPHLLAAYTETLATRRQD